MPKSLASLCKTWKRRFGIAHRLFLSGDIKKLFKRSIFFITKNIHQEPEIDYAEWRKKWVELTPEKRAEIKKRVSSNNKTTFEIIIRAENTPISILEKTINSFLAQLYPDWILLIIIEKFVSEDLRSFLNDLGDKRIKIVVVANPAYQVGP